MAQCGMMGDVFLHAVDICFSYELMNKADLTNGQAGCIGGVTRLGGCGEEKAESEPRERHHVPTRKIGCLRILW